MAKGNNPLQLKLEIIYPKPQEGGESGKKAVIILSVRFQGQPAENRLVNIIHNGMSMDEFPQETVEGRVVTECDVAPGQHLFIGRDIETNFEVSQRLYVPVEKKENSRGKKLFVDVVGREGVYEILISVVNGANKVVTVMDRFAEKNIDQVNLGTSGTHKLMLNFVNQQPERILKIKLGNEEELSVRLLGINPRLTMDKKFKKSEDLWQ